MKLVKIVFLGVLFACGQLFSAAYYYPEASQKPFNLYVQNLTGANLGVQIRKTGHKGNAKYAVPATHREAFYVGQMMPGMEFVYTYTGYGGREFEYVKPFDRFVGVEDVDLLTLYAAPSARQGWKFVEQSVPFSKKDTPLEAFVEHIMHIINNGWPIKRVELVPGQLVPIGLSDDEAKEVYRLLDKYNKVLETTKKSAEGTPNRDGLLVALSGVQQEIFDQLHRLLRMRG